jgi:hypothetical protein
MQERPYAISEELAREKFFESRPSSSGQTMSNEIDKKYQESAESGADNNSVINGSYGVVHFDDKGESVFKKAFSGCEGELQIEIETYIRMASIPGSENFSLYKGFGPDSLWMKNGGEPLRVYLEDLWEKEGAAEKILALMQQILAILEWLHKGGITHGDFHFDNVLVAVCVDKEDHAWPIDFGSARFKVNFGNPIEDNDWAELVVADYQKLVRSMITWVTGKKRSYDKMSRPEEEQGIDLSPLEQLEIEVENIKHPKMTAAKPALDELLNALKSAMKAYN